MAEDRALDAARAAFDAGQERVACFIAEPIQGEGGDNHLSSRFLKAMQDLCHANDALFVLDEVQTGCGATGTAWAYQQLAIEPDLVAFGKKTQVCGVMAGRRVCEIPDNVFTVSSRISSTWGGSLADMVRATRILGAIAAENLFASAAVHGQFLLSGLDALVAKYPDVLSNARGRGLMCALDVSHPTMRDNLIRRLYRDEHVIALPCGETGVRFRPHLAVTEYELTIALEAVGRCASSLTAQSSRYEDR